MLNWTRDSHEGESRADAAAVPQKDVASQHAPALCQNPDLGLQGDFTVFNKTTLHLVIIHVGKELILYFSPLLFSKNNLPVHGEKKNGGKH